MNLTLERWLSLAFFGLTLISVGIISVVSYTQLRDAVLERTQNQLLSINILKQQLVEQYALTQPALTATSLRALTDPVAVAAVSPAVQAYRRGLEAIVTERTGMGATGESYLVTDQGRMMTVSRFMPDTLPGSIVVATRGFQAARAGQTGVALYRDYRHVPIIGAYRPVKLAGHDGVLLTEIDVAEAMQPVETLRHRFLWFLFGLLVVSGLVSAWLARQLAQPIRVLQQDIITLAQGTLPRRLPQPSRIKEMNAISASLSELIQVLKQAVDFARQVGQGNFTAPHQPLSQQDQLGHALLTMRDQLVQLNLQQEGVERETKKRLVDTQEAERERIARDIHDGIGPLLTTAKLKLFSLPDSPGREEVRHLLGEVIGELRRTSRNLMPAVLRDFGPGEALNQLVGQLRQSSDIQVRYANDLLSKSRLPKEISVTLYRVAQEAINNTLKHTAATQVVMSLTEFNDRVVFYYQDNGPGLPPGMNETSPGQGLNNIRERIRILKGSVRIYSEPGTTSTPDVSTRGTSVRGTIIEAEIPLT